MKKIILLLAVTFFIGSAAIAQSRTSEDAINKRVESMDEKVNLTADQEIKVKQLYSDYQSQIEEKKDQMEREELRAYMNKAKEEMKKELKTILTAEQLAKLEDSAKARKSRSDERSRR